MKGLQPPASAVPLFLWLLGTFPTGTCHRSPQPHSRKMWSSASMFSAHPLQPTVNAPPLNHSPQRSCSGMDKDGAARGCPTALQIPWDQRDTVLTGLGWGVVGCPCLVAPQRCSPCGCSSAPCLTAVPPQHQMSPWHRCSHGSSILGKMRGRILGADPPQVLVSRSRVPATFRIPVAAPLQTGE